LLRSGSINILPAGQAPRALIAEPLRALHIYLPQSSLANQARELEWSGATDALEVVDLLFKPDAHLERLGSIIAETLDAHRPQQKLYIDALASAVTTRVLLNWTNLTGSRTLARMSTKGGLTPWQERRAIEYLADNMARDVALGALANATGLSIFHFARMFKLATGLPPHACQRRLRSEKAKQLLAETYLSVGQIAEAVGYETPQAFARMFRAEVGASPSDYRRQRRT
jgi:AraC-like DNA-binding protein